MKAEIAPSNAADNTVVSISEGESIRVYRDPDSLHEVMINKEGETIPLGIRDASVSREYNEAGETSYIELYIENHQVHVLDTGSSNPTTVHNFKHGEIELTDGKTHVLTGDCKVAIGATSALLVNITRDQLSGKSAIRVQADMVHKISDMHNAETVKNEAEVLKNMLQREFSGDEKFETVLSELNAAIEQTKGAVEFDPSASLSEGGFDEAQREIANTADKVRKLL